MEEMKKHQLAINVHREQYANIPSNFHPQSATLKRQSLHSHFNVLAEYSANQENIPEHLTVTSPGCTQLYSHSTLSTTLGRLRQVQQCLHSGLKKLENSRHQSKLSKLAERYFRLCCYETELEKDLKACSQLQDMQQSKAHRQLSQLQQQLSTIDKKLNASSKCHIPTKQQRWHSEAETQGEINTKHSCQQHQLSRVYHVDVEFKRSALLAVSVFRQSQLAHLRHYLAQRNAELVGLRQNYLFQKQLASHNEQQILHRRQSIRYFRQDDNYQLQLFGNIQSYRKRLVQQLEHEQLSILSQERCQQELSTLINDGDEHQKLLCETYFLLDLCSSFKKINHNISMLFGMHCKLRRLHQQNISNENRIITKKELIERMRDSIRRKEFWMWEIRATKTTEKTKTKNISFSRGSSRMAASLVWFVLLVAAIFTYLLTKNHS